MESGNPGIPKPLPSRFDVASQEILSFLRDAVPMGLWTVTRVVDDMQIYLSVEDSAYGVPAGVSVPWPAALCKYMLTGCPHIARDVSAVPDYHAITEADGGRVAAYVGYPLRTVDGELFGTLCAFNPQPLAPSFDRHHALLELLARLLSTILDADLERTRMARELELAELRATKDGLTGLLNRSAWDRLVAHEEARLRRFGSSCAVLAIDLDGLKMINDNQGHLAGDAHLRKAAKVLSAAIRESDVLARVGGDEFAVLAPGTDSLGAAELERCLAEALATGGIPASIGHAQFSLPNGLAEAWNRADTEMYRRKQSRRHR